MSETALKFGPEWLRVLSHGGSVSSPPPSPGVNKMKRAEHRYGREEMLALFNKHQSPPDGMQALGSLYVDKAQEPLAFIPMNEEEQRMWQRGVNSDVVLRQAGRAPVNGVGRGRGGSVDRGRGRGRGTASYYTRGLSYDEEVEPRGHKEGGPPGIGIRSKPYERSQSVHEQRPWSERAPAGTVPGVGVVPEDRNGAVSPRKEQGRASTENWRSRAGENDDSERWRGVGGGRSEKWGPRGWRERENGLEGDWEEGLGRGSTRGMPASSRGMRQPWDEKDGHFRKSWDEDNLPEWYIVRATENSDEKGGSFDASGAFHGPGSGWSDEEEPTAEGRGCGPGRPRQKSSSPDKGILPENSATDKAEAGKGQDDSESLEEKAQKKGMEEEPQPRHSPMNNGMDPAQALHPPIDSIPSEVHFFNIYGSTTEESQGREENRGSPNEMEPGNVIPEAMMNGVASEEESSGREAPAPPPFQGGVGPVPVPVPVQAQNSEGPEPVPGLGREHQGEEEKLEHMQSVADDLVAKLVEEDDPRPRSNPPNPGVTPPGQMGPMPEPAPHPTHTATEDKWYYTDPQGEIQGPFSSNDMAEWYKAGYFTPSLLLKRDCDDQFAQLGDLTRVFGRVPFIPGPPVPPLKLPELLAAQKQQAERERLELLQTYMLQKQVYQQQIAARQQVLQKLQSLEEWSTLNPIQQQQLFMQHMMTMFPGHPPIPPTVPPSTAIPQTTQVSAPIPDPRIVAGPDPRILPGPAGPPSSKPQDPIQALVAQMQTNSITNNTAMTSSCEGLLTSQLTATSMAAENPLQKLLMQLQRGQQPGMGPMGGGPVGGGALGVGMAGAAGGVGGVTAPSVATPPTTVPTIEKPPEQQFDAIQSLMQQLTNMQTPAQDQIQQEEQRRRDEDQKRIEEERKLLEDQKRAEEERIKIEELRLKEELKRQEEQRRSLEALRRQHEEEAQRLEEERRKIMEEQIRRQEEMRRIEEEKVRKEEEQKKLKDQQMNEAKRRQEEQLRRQEEHRRQQQQQQQQQQQHQQQQQQQQQQQHQQQQQQPQHQQQQQQQQQQLLQQQQQQQLLQQKQQEEAAKRKEEARRQEELRRQQEEERKRQEEERRRREEEEEEARQQAQIQEEMRRIALEEERRHMQQVEEEERQRQAEEEDRRHQHLLHLKNILPAWNTQNPAPAPEAAPAPSLADIQRAQEEKERREREVELQMQQQRQRDAQRQAAEEARQKNSGLKWAAKAQANPAPAPVKSLLEIQAEEEKELKKRQEKEAAERAAAVSHMSLGAAGVWGSAMSNLSWASRASTVGTTAASHQSSQQWGGNSGGQSAGGGLWNNTSQPAAVTTSNPGQSVWNNDHSSIWNHADNSSSTGGFWDNPEPSKPKPASGRTPTKPNNPNQNHNRGGGPAGAPQHNNSTSTRVSKKKNKDESDMVKKLFTENVSQADNFTQWCKSSLNTMKVHASIDIPTFVTFLAEVESPYEVHDYIRSYLGDSKEVREFAKQYLERRSKARNAQKEREVEDDILAPAPAVNPTTSEFQEVKARSRKANKKKMQKVDSSILGFNVTSNERINVGEREYAE